MDDSTSDSQVNQSEVDFETKSNEIPEIFGCRSVIFGFDDQFVPNVGMTFKTLDDAAKFYKDYSKDVGIWIISKVVLHHSHPCCPDQAQMLQQHRKLSMSVRRTIENNEEAGIRPSKTFQSFVAIAGGHRELNFIEKDVRNYITREVRNVSEQEDAKEFGKYLLRMKEKNQNFFFELELEDDQSIKLAFWADARSIVACEYIGDVISFDTTYNTNRYNLVCGSFVGVNHHGQSTLLGFDLMKNEDIESFKWLFQCWLPCMGGNALKGILTDQCASMQRAIETCMPTIIYYWCIWHIITKIPSKLNGYNGHTEIQQEISQVVWNSHTKESFDKNWDDFLLKYGLVDNKWLSELEELTAILHRAYDKVMVAMEELKVKRKGTFKPFDAASVVRQNSNQYHGHVMNYQFSKPAAGDSFLGV
ncbi:protein FAR1-RELATED SEQUENCE 5-like [Arachis stenosperma]|uniref:protein FAR1-RELATED SEQUENCE 5-like n=1 Tax=Arachis stenosperma TaxID=217475 RepID=UPI0025AC1749|nr:protein FAR1-RELATED SEQUENCE 5-like [Arachis stenosperma]